MKKNNCLVWIHWGAEEGRLEQMRPDRQPVAGGGGGGDKAGRAAPAVDSNDRG